MTRSNAKTTVLVNQQGGSLFDTIESSHQYVQLLADVVSEVRKDLENEARSEPGAQFPRRFDAIRLALYNLDKLHFHMKVASRILNDLRSLRRLLLEERQETMNISSS
jgi:hypothetical protein